MAAGSRRSPVARALGRASARGGWTCAAALAAVLVLTSCATPSPAPPQASGAAGDFAGPVDIGAGRHLFLECHGQGTPTVILESGYHDSSDPWSLTDATRPAVGPAVLPGLAATHRVCAYDRPGTLRYTDPVAITDRSSPVPMPRTAKDVVGDLHALLAAAQVPEPYVLVAHSLGGLFARLYAQTYPDQVRALLFLDSFPAQIPALMGPQWPAYERLLDHPLPQFAASPTFEVIDIPASVGQIAGAAPFPAIPVAVVTKTEPFPLPPDAPAGLGPTLDRVWPQGALDLVALRPQTPHIIATGSDHYVQVHQPDLVIATATLLIDRSAQPSR
jgi:pimeloyl-ACP methyl ester carboxylesterase